MAVITETVLTQRARDIHFDGTDAKSTRLNTQFINDALRMVATMANWEFLEKWHRIITAASYNTGEVVVTQGARTVALATASSADWTTSWGGSSKLYGIEIAGRPPLLEILSVIGSVASAAYTARLITRTEHTWHGDSQTAGSYHIRKERYTLPSNTRSIAGAQYEDQITLGYVDEEDWRHMKDVSVSSGQPLYYTFLYSTADDRHEMGLWPYPDDEYAIDVFVRKWPALLTAGGAANTEFPIMLEPLVFTVLEALIYKYRRQFQEATAAMNVAYALLPRFKGAMSKFTGIRYAGRPPRIESMFANRLGSDAT